MSNTNKKPVSKIFWEYCECGCHGHVLVNGPIERWLYNSLRKVEKPFHLYVGHSLSGRAISTFSSFEEADSFVKDELQVFVQSIQNFVNNVHEIYDVFDSGKPARTESSVSWENNSFASFNEAVAYAKLWLGCHNTVIPNNWDGSAIKHPWNGFGDMIEIRTLTAYL